MPSPLPVHLNRNELHGLEVPDSFKATGGFDVRLVNHGAPTHVHLHLDDSLSQIAALEAPNHYVKRESERPVRVTVTGEGAARGSLKVVTAHGATTRYVDVSITEPEPTEGTVEVGDELAEPQPKPDPEAASATGRRSPMLAVGVVVLAAVAVLTVVFQGLLVLTGVLAVAIAVLVLLSVADVI